MRLTDADAFREELCKHFAGYGTHENDTKEDIEWNEALAWFIEQLDKAPTIDSAIIAEDVLRTIREHAKKTCFMLKPTYVSCGACMYQGLIFCTKKMTEHDTDRLSGIYNEILRRKQYD